MSDLIDLRETLYPLSPEIALRNMAHAEKCPICDGEGIRPPNDPYDELPNKDKKRRKWPTCHGCDGKGWVEVSDGVKSNWTIFDGIAAQMVRDNGSNPHGMNGPYTVLGAATE